MPKQTFFNLPEQKRESIRKATYKIFIEEGFEQANIRKVANYAGISVGSFYQYFEDLDDLYLYFFIQTEIKYVECQLQLTNSIIFEEVEVPLEDVLNEEEIQFNFTWYSAPVEIIQKFYFMGYSDEILYPLKNELKKMKEENKFALDVDIDFIYYIYKTSLFNLLMYFKEKNIEDKQEKYKLKKLFFREILLKSLLK